MNTISTSKRSQGFGVFHHRTTELDYGEPAMELAEVTECLDQDIRLADCFFMHGEIPNRSQTIDDQTTILPFLVALCKVGGGFEARPECARLGDEAPFVLR